MLGLRDRRWIMVLVLCLGAGIGVSHVLGPDPYPRLRPLFGLVIGALVFLLVRRIAAQAWAPEHRAAYRARLLGTLVLIGAGFAQGTDVDRPWPLVLLIVGFVLSVGAEVGIESGARPPARD